MPSCLFQNPFPDMAGAKPVMLRLGAASYATPTWAKVLEMAARAMLDGARTRKAALAAIKRLSWFGDKKRMLRPRELEDGIWIELNLNARDILKRTRVLLEVCGYPLDQASLEYENAPHVGPKERRDGTNPMRDLKKLRAKSAKSTNPVWNTSAPRPNKGGDHTGERLGAYAKLMLFQALAEKGRIPDEDFKTHQTKEGTKALLGISLTTCPLFSLSPMIRRDGGRGSWIDPVTHDGKPIYVNSQWYEEYREKLDK